MQWHQDQWANFSDLLQSFHASYVFQRRFGWVSFLIAVIISDSGNAAFVLSDKRKQFNEKACFILSQPWCYGFILLVFLAIVSSNAVLIVMSMKPTNTVVVVVDRETWDADPAKPGLKSLQLPVKRIILTHTADEEKSCKTQVCWTSWKIIWD